MGVEGMSTLLTDANTACSNVSVADIKRTLFENNKQNTPLAKTFGTAEQGPLSTVPNATKTSRTLGSSTNGTFSAAASTSADNGKNPPPPVAPKPKILNPEKLLNGNSQGNSQFHATGKIDTHHEQQPEATNTHSTHTADGGMYANSQINGHPPGLAGANNVGHIYDIGNGDTPELPTSQQTFNTKLLQLQTLERLSDDNLLQTTVTDTKLIGEYDAIANVVGQQHTTSTDTKNNALYSTVDKSPPPPTRTSSLKTAESILADLKKELEPTTRLGKIKQQAAGLLSKTRLGRAILQKGLFQLSEKQQKERAEKSTELFSNIPSISFDASKADKFETYAKKALSGISKGNSSELRPAIAQAFGKLAAAQTQNSLMRLFFTTQQGQYGNDGEKETAKNALQTYYHDKQKIIANSSEKYSSLPLVEQAKAERKMLAAIASAHCDWIVASKATVSEEQLAKLKRLIKESFQSIDHFMVPKTKWECAKRSLASTIKAKWKAPTFAGAAGIGIVALTSHPVGWAILGVAAVGSALYSGYGVYKAIRETDKTGKLPDSSECTKALKQIEAAIKKLKT